MSDLLAIVIPYYKKTFFRQTLQSLANQTDKRFRVYVGNDASPENPSDLIEEFEGQFDLSYKKFNENLGGISLVQQWHRCIDLVQDEEWLVVLGDDDMVDNKFVSSFYASIGNVIEEKINVIRCSSIVIDSYGQQISQVHIHPKIEDANIFLLRKLKGETRSSLSEYIFNKKELLKFRFKNLPLAWYSDLLAVLECSGFDKIFTINNTVVSFRLSGQNITSRTDDLTIKNVATFEFYFDLLKYKREMLQPELKNLLHNRLEKTFLDNKKLISRWSKFTCFYLKIGYFKRYSLFLTKCIEKIQFRI